jgi:hypothetical protein
MLETAIDTAPDAIPPKRRPLALLWLSVAGAVIIAALMGVWALNYFAADRPLQRVLTADQRNHAVKASAHWGSWLNPDTLVFNVTDVSGASRMDVFRVFLQYADEVQNKHYSRVILAAKGTAKFEIDGVYFQGLGKEYSSQNPVYTIRTFPAHVVTMDGARPFHEYEGGIFAVLTAEMDQFTKFSDEWYLND